VAGEAAHDSGHVLEPVPAGDLHKHRVIRAGAAFPDHHRRPGDEIEIAVAAYELCRDLRRATVKHAEFGEDSSHGGGVEILVFR
jgi:hypothetical protein